MTPKVRSLAVLAIGLAIFASCKKKTDDPVKTTKPTITVEDSVKTLLTGKWKVTRSAQDMNANGVMDSNEVAVLPDSIVEYVTFNSNDSGNISYTFSGSSNSFLLTWKLINSAKDIVVTSHQSGASPTPDTIHIETLTLSDGLFSTSQDNGSGVRVNSWTFLHKQ